MKKLLVSDLFGTLIPQTLYGFQYYSGRDMFKFNNISSDNVKIEDLINKSFKMLSMQLDKYLGDGNYLCVVTSLDGHDEPSYVFNEIIKRLYEYNVKYKEQIIVYFSIIKRKTGLDDLSKVAHIYDNNGNLVATDGDINAYIIGNKEEVFDSLSKRLNLDDYDIYAIGDTYRDFRMLYKCFELGGKSSFIENDLYNDVISLHLLLCESVHINMKINFRNKLKIENDNFENMSYIEQEELILNMFDDSEDYYQKEYERLLNLIRIGKLDVDYLLKRNKIYSIICEYNDQIVPFVPITYELLDSFTAYPTFKDYSVRNLVKKQ